MKKKKENPEKHKVMNGKEWDGYNIYYQGGAATIRYNGTGELGSCVGFIWRNMGFFSGR